MSRLIGWMAAPSLSRLNAIWIFTLGFVTGITL